MSPDGAVSPDGAEATAAPWRSAAAQVLVADLDSPELDDGQAHHLRRVLRLRPGAELCASDGDGGWRRCRLGADGALEVSGERRRSERPEPPVTVAFALVKGERPELVVQKLTELGVDRIIGFSAQRSVVRPDPERAARQLGRLRRVAIEACAQSRRLWLPQVDLLADTAAVVASARSDPTGGAGGAPGVVAADAGGRPPRGSDRWVLVGPEGGWDPGEVDDLERVGLAEDVLRAETAAITAGALLVSLRAGRVAPAAAPTP